MELSEKARKVIRTAGKVGLAAVGLFAATLVRDEYVYRTKVLPGQMPERSFGSGAEGDMPYRQSDGPAVPIENVQATNEPHAGEGWKPPIPQTKPPLSTYTHPWEFKPPPGVPDIPGNRPPNYGGQQQ